MSKVTIIRCDGCGTNIESHTVSYPPSPLKIEFDEMRIEWVDACPKCVAKARKLLEAFQS